MSDFNANTKFIYTTSDGNFEFDIAPRGGDETEQNISRSKKTDGMVQNIVQNLEFVQGVKDLIVSEWLKKGVDALFKVTKKEKYFNDFFTINSGFLMFDSLKWDKTSATGDFVDSSFDSVLRDNIREKFELDRTTDINNNPIPALEKQRLLWKPRKIFLFSQLETRDPYDSQVTVDSLTPYISVPITKTADSDENIVATFPNTDGTYFVGYNSGDDTQVFPQAQQFFYLRNDRYRTIKVNVNVSFKFLFTSAGVSNQFFKIRIQRTRYSDGPTYTNQEMYELVELNGDGTIGVQTLSYNGSIEITMEKEDCLCLFYAIPTNISGFDKTFEPLTDKITITEDSFHEPLDPDEQYMDCLPIRDAFARCVEILDPEVEFVSSLLDEASSLSGDNWANIVVTGGETIRHVIYTEDDSQLNNLPPILTTSFEELYNALFSITPVAYTIITENGKTKLYLEAIDYVFDTEEAVDIGQLNDVEYFVNGDKTYSAVEIGSTTKGEDDEVFGLQAFNTKNTYQLPLKGDNTYQATTKYVTDPNIAELHYRKQHSEYPDITRKNDKDVFMFDCKKVTFNGVDIYTPHIWQEHFSSVKGIYDVDSGYNYRLSPINCAFRHAKNFKQEYTKEQYIGKSMVYSSTEGNPSLKTTITGGTERAESGSFLLSIMDDPMYTNLQIEGHAAFNRTIRDLINAGDKPNYLKTFVWTDENGFKAKAYAYDIGINKEKMEFELVEKYR